MLYRLGSDWSMLGYNGCDEVWLVLFTSWVLWASDKSITKVYSWLGPGVLAVLLFLFTNPLWTQLTSPNIYISHGRNKSIFILTGFHSGPGHQPQHSSHNSLQRGLPFSTTVTSNLVWIDAHYSTSWSLHALFKAVLHICVHMYLFPVSPTSLGAAEQRPFLYTDIGHPHSILSAEYIEFFPQMVNEWMGGNSQRHKDHVLIHFYVISTKDNAQCKLIPN